MGSDWDHSGHSSAGSISIHAPRVGSDSGRSPGRCWRLISIHAPRVGSDHRIRRRDNPLRYFNPRSPCGERPWEQSKEYFEKLFQSTLPVWGATILLASSLPGNAISIHAPRVGSDNPCCTRKSWNYRFQSTLPVWGATTNDATSSPVTVFQSTLPVWGATAVTANNVSDVTDFNPRSPCGERPAAPQVAANLTLHFNPRSPCGERPGGRGGYLMDSEFQSTLPVWGATGLQYILALRRHISIHAPRVGSDSSRQTPAGNQAYFNPRSPCGERQRRALPGIYPHYISIHAPRVGSDEILRRSRCGTRDFNPRSPCGERLELLENLAFGILISIHAPRVGSDSGLQSDRLHRPDFNPRSPCGERQWIPFNYAKTAKFQSTLPVWGATRRLSPSWHFQLISIHAPRVGSDSNRIDA